MKIRTIKTIKISDFNCELNSGHHLNAFLCALCFWWPNYALMYSLDKS